MWLRAWQQTLQAHVCGCQAEGSRQQGRVRCRSSHSGWLADCSLLNKVRTSVRARRMHHTMRSRFLSSSLISSNLQIKETDQTG